MGWIILVNILGFLVLVLGFTTWNLLKKNEKFEEIINNENEFREGLKFIIKESSKKLEEIDSKGSFKADDEVGYFFKILKEIQDELSEYTK